MKKMDAKTVIVWGLAIYGAYSLVKTQTKFLSAAGPAAGSADLTQGWRSRMSKMNCNGLNNVLGRLTSKLNMIQSRPAGKRSPKWQAQLKKRISFINQLLSDKGC